MKNDLDDSVRDRSVVLKSVEGGTHQALGGRGLFVPDGLSAAEIMAAADALERDFDFIAPYESRSIARTVLLAARAAGE